MFQSLSRQASRTSPATPLSFPVLRQPPNSGSLNCVRLVGVGPKHRHSQAGRCTPYRPCSSQRRQGGHPRLSGSRKPSRGSRGITLRPGKRCRRPFWRPVRLLFSSVVLANSADLRVTGWCRSVLSPMVTPRKSWRHVRASCFCPGAALAELGSFPALSRRSQAPAPASAVRSLTFSK